MSPTPSYYHGVPSTLGMRQRVMIQAMLEGKDITINLRGSQVEP